MDDWSSSHNWDYWNINFTDAASVNNTETIKTIYDPSVSGFVLPKTATFTGFTSSGGETSNYNDFNVSGNFLRGWNFYTDGWKTGNTILFYTLGLRDTYGGRSTGTGVIINALDNGAYWSCGPYSSSYSRFFTFELGNVNPQHKYERCYGLSIRSVLE